MDAIEVLHNRVSCALLQEPGPSREQLNDLLQAALRAPDHANLKPARFWVVEGEARNKLGDLFAKVSQAKNPIVTDAELEKVRKKPLRAPTIIVAAAKVVEHPKVPRIEQVITAGAAANNIVTAAFALGIGAYWRTGGMAFDPTVKAEFGLGDSDEIVGFIYLGTPKVSMREVPEYRLEDFVSEWGTP